VILEGMAEWCMFLGISVCDAIFVFDDSKIGFEFVF
jgi:hypothetical protein